MLTTDYKEDRKEMLSEERIRHWAIHLAVEQIEAQNQSDEDVFIEPSITEDTKLSEDPMALKITIELIQNIGSVSRADALLPMTLRQIIREAGVIKKELEQAAEAERADAEENNK